MTATFPVLGNGTRNVRIQPDGHYGVDASDLDPIVGGWGWMSYTDRLGNTTSCPFKITGYQGILPWLWNIP